MDKPSRCPGRGGGMCCTCVADARVVDLDAHLVGPRRRHLDVLIAELLAGAPGDGGLAGDGLDAVGEGGLAKLSSSTRGEGRRVAGPQAALSSGRGKLQDWCGAGSGIGE